ncbi:DUF4283 domain-containing protein [Cephalotus follicularis]|uniref:DUF4283 domain-containing protein n=1 Tax=Cephalotus follicularis TaxID=3775 RepID=A0A1Q3BKN7_CEPFO|nr:DUF4283 domain-containing protein [Cephalotus follicularis]
MPLVNLSPHDVKLASDFHAYSLIAKFSLLRPPVDLFEHHINSSWGLIQPATVGLLDPKHILIHLHSAEDFAKAWSRESKFFDNLRYLLLIWTADFTKRKDSSLSAMWLRLPGLPLPCQNPAILEIIGNSFGRFLRLDERTKKMKHPMAPRLYVEMNLAVKLPEVVMIAIGSEVPFQQKIEYDLRIGYCTFCHLQGHQESICRRKQSQASPQAAEPSTSSPQGNASSLISNAIVVGAALPAGVHRLSARRPNRSHVTNQPAPNPIPPPVCQNAQVTLSTHFSNPIPPPSQPTTQTIDLPSLNVVCPTQPAAIPPLVGSCPISHSYQPPGQWA